MKLAATILVASLALAASLQASSLPDANRLVEAIGKAENSKAHPYGVMIRCRNPRQVCLNTVLNSETRWLAAGQPGDFVVFLAKTYAPLKVANDLTCLNRNWVRNVRWFLAHP